MSPSFPEPRQVASPGARVCDAVIVGFALWTLLCNGIVFAGGSLDDLLRGAGVLAAVSIVALLVGQRLRARTGGAVSEESRRTAPEETSGLVLDRHGAVALAGAAVICGAYVAGVDRFVLWALATVHLLYHVARDLSGRPRDTSAETPSWDEGRRPCSRRQVFGVWALALVAGALPLFAHQYNLDDTFYVNLAVAAVDDPQAPLLASDTLHGVPELPIMYAAYKVGSYELLAAAVAATTPLTALQASHWVLPALFGVLMVLATARLLRRLVPDAWVPCLAATLAILVFVAEAPQFYGGFTLLRMHQGKSAFLSVALPLIVVHASRFGAAPTWRGWALLAATQVAALGMTSTAIWLAPVVTAITLLATVRPTIGGARVAALGCATSAYLIVVGLALRSESLTEIRAESARMSIDGAGFLLEAWSRVLGTGVVSVVALGAGLAAFCLLRQPGARRLAQLLPLAMLLFFFNPFFAQDVAEGITGPPTYWRVLWITPLPVFVALLLCAPLLVGRPAASSGGRWVLVAALVATFVIGAPVTHAFSEERKVRWEAFGLKVNPAALEMARALREHVPVGGSVLAPVRVSCALVTLHHHPQPVATRPLYLNIQSARLGTEDARLRKRLTDHVTGGTPMTDTAFGSAVESMGLAGVCFPAEMAHAADVREVVASLGFERIEDRGLAWEAWVRPAGVGGPSRR